MKRSTIGKLAALVLVAAGGFMFAPEKAPAARDAGSGFFVFDTQAEADAYIEECDKAIGYPMPGVPAQPYPKGWTLTYAVPREIAGRWYVQAHPSVRAVAALVEARPDPVVLTSGP